MTLKNEFIQKLAAAANRHDPYIWGGQGEKVKDVTLSFIRTHETTSGNRDRVMQHLLDLYRTDQITDESRIWDCSGLITQSLIELGLLAGDMTADGLLHRCNNVSKTDKTKKLKPGMLVFRVSSSGAYHVGAVVAANGTVVEAKGRDDGVVMRIAPAGYWTHCGEIF